jgi:DNA-binding NtrC family response regulator
MKEKFDKPTIHAKLETVIREIVDKELQLKDVLKEFEKIYIETAMRKYKGNMSRMAKALGIHRNTLRNRTKSLKISRKN